MNDEPLSVEIWMRLVQNEPLDGLGLGTKNGRVDLRGLRLPEPSVVRQLYHNGTLLAGTNSGVVVKSAKWRRLDFTGCKFRGLRLFECELNDCCFDRCQFQDLRVWSTTISDCSFEGANLRKASLGGVQDGKRNLYVGVNFANADLRETVYKAASFAHCNFRHSKLVKIDFQTSTFADCVFEGELRDVLFYRSGFEGEAFPSNEMVNVDFSGAKLRDVSFRGLTLGSVTLPQDSDHVVIRDVAATLDGLIKVLEVQGDKTAKRLIAFLLITRKWAHPNQAQGVINLCDLQEIAGVEGVRRLRDILSVV